MADNQNNNNNNSNPVDINDLFFEMTNDGGFGAFVAPTVQGQQQTQTPQSTQTPPASTQQINQPLPEVQQLQQQNQQLTAQVQQLMGYVASLGQTQQSQQQQQLSQQAQNFNIVERLQQPDGVNYLSSVIANGIDQGVNQRLAPIMPILQNYTQQQQIQQRLSQAANQFPDFNEVVNSNTQRANELFRQYGSIEAAYFAMKNELLTGQQQGYQQPNNNILNFNNNNNRNLQPNGQPVTMDALQNIFAQAAKLSSTNGGVFGGTPSGNTTVAKPTLEQALAMAVNENMRR